MTFARMSDSQQAAFHDLTARGISAADALAVSKFNEGARADYLAARAEGQSHADALLAMGGSGSASFPGTFVPGPGERLATKDDALAVLREGLSDKYDEEKFAKQRIAEELVARMTSDHEAIAMTGSATYDALARFQNAERDAKELGGVVVYDRTGNMNPPSAYATPDPEADLKRSQGGGYDATTDPAVARQWLAETAVSNLISRWAATSNDTEAKSIAIQEQAEKTFGLEGVAPWGMSSDMRERVDRDLAAHGAVYDDFLRAMHANTQEAFARAGITHVEATRGFRWSKYEDEGGPRPPWMAEGRLDGKVVDPPLRPLSSFALTVMAANSFGGAGGSNSDQLRAIIPVSRIVGSARSGFGCLNEDEIVVMHTSGTYQVPGKNE